MIATKFDVSGKGIKSIDELLEETGSNWMANPEELVTVGGLDLNGNLVEGVSVPKTRAIVRQDTRNVIGIVGSRYQPVQNSTAFAFFDTICAQENATYEHVYEIDGGRKLIAQAKVGGFTVRDGDDIEKYVTLINSFDGSSPVLAYFTTTRLWCQNQLTASLRNATNKVAIRHTGDMDARLHEASIVMAKSTKFFDVFAEKCKFLANKAADKALVDAFLDEVIGETDKEAKTKKRENNKNAIISLFESGLGNNGSSMWDLVNGVTEWVDHRRSDNDEKRMASAIAGAGFKIKDRAFNAALSLVA